MICARCIGHTPKRKLHTTPKIKTVSVKNFGKGSKTKTAPAMDEGNGYANAFKPHHFQTALGIPGLVASDTHNGLKAALKASLNSTPWQRCQSHLQHNAQEYVT